LNRLILLRRLFLSAIEVPPVPIDRSEYVKFESTDPTPLDSSQLGRGKLRAARATVDYRELEDDEDDMEIVSQSTKKQRLQVSKKQRLRVSEAQRFTNQMSRPRLEQLVVDLYRSSAESSGLSIMGPNISVELGWAGGLGPAQQLLFDAFSVTSSYTAHRAENDNYRCARCLFTPDAARL
jgi:hypothetical protein